MWTIIKQLAASAGDYCLLCRAAATGDSLCGCCAQQLPRVPQACIQCGLPLPDSHARRCGECLAHPPAFDLARIPYLYADPVKGLVSDLKYRGRLAEGRLLAQQLARHAHSRRVDVLIPIPLHPERLRERGFNQAAELCRELSRQNGIPWQSGLLTRVHPGVSQRGSNRRARMRNVRGAFHWSTERPCPPRVALVDDVVTTGATAGSAAACLKQAGAEWVEVWAVARTPRE